MTCSQSNPFVPINFQFLPETDHTNRIIPSQHCAVRCALETWYIDVRSPLSWIPELLLNLYLRDTGIVSSRTQGKQTYPIVIIRLDLSKVKLPMKKYRNPVIYAHEPHDEMVWDGLPGNSLLKDMVFPLIGSLSGSVC